MHPLITVPYCVARTVKAVPDAGVRKEAVHLAEGAEGAYESYVCSRRTAIAKASRKKGSGIARSAGRAFQSRPETPTGMRLVAATISGRRLLEGLRLATADTVRDVVVHVLEGFPALQLI